MKVGLGYDKTDLNGNARPELIFAWVDNVNTQNPPDCENKAYYVIGYDADYKDIPTGWSETKPIAINWIGCETAEASMSLKDINNSGKPELIFAWVQGVNVPIKAYYAIGFDLDASGNPTGGWIGARPYSTTTGARRDDEWCWDYLGRYKSEWRTRYGILLY